MNRKVANVSILEIFIKSMKYLYISIISSVVMYGVTYLAFNLFNDKVGIIEFSEMFIDLKFVLVLLMLVLVINYVFFKLETTALFESKNIKEYRFSNLFRFYVECQHFNGQFL